MTCTGRRCRCGQHPDGLRDVGKSDVRPTASEIKSAHQDAVSYRTDATRYPKKSETHQVLLGMACVADATADRMAEGV